MIRKTLLVVLVSMISVTTLAGAVSTVPLGTETHVA